MPSLDNIQEQIQHERDMEFFNNPVAREFVKNMGDDTKIIQVGKGGTTHINIGRKKKNNNS